MDRPLKLGLVSPYDHSVPGGVSQHISELAAQFRAWGHTVKIIAPCSDPDKITEEGFIPMGRPVPVPAGGSVARISLSVWLRPRIKALLEKEVFDILHLHEPYAGFVTLNCLHYSKAVNIATFHSYRGTRIYHFGVRRLGIPYNRKLQGRIAVSEPARQFINQQFPADYRVIPNGINSQEITDAKPFPHLQDGMINLLFVGRLEKRKGLKYLLKAYGRLKWDWPNLRLLIVGPGKPDDDSYRTMSERNLQDVVFLGRVSHEDKARYFQSADIYCSPATGGESFGIVLLEAMAAGKPIVATSIEGYSTVMTHNREGLMVPPKKEDALADAIEALLKDPDLRARFGEEGKRRVQEYTWGHVAKRVMDYYTQYLPDPTPAFTG
ncbi:MAG: glycosyltransferase family 4 protein [Chloroflexi bacterium]|nr:glycosyltransferase family 4 protein [Chloroflexota bacterium]